LTRNQVLRPFLTRIGGSKPYANRGDAAILNGNQKARALPRRDCHKGPADDCDCPGYGSDKWRWPGVAKTGRVGHSRIGFFTGCGANYREAENAIVGLSSLFSNVPLRVVRRTRKE
jgi:hypothetical protein